MTPSPGELAERLARIRELGQADRASVSVFDRDDGTFELVEWDGDWLLAPGTRFPLPTSTHFSVAARGRAWVSTDFSDDQRFTRPVDAIVRAHGFRSGSCVPLATGGVVRGALALHHRTTGVRAREAPARIGAELAGLAGALRAPGSQATVDVLVHHADPLVGRGLLHLLAEDSGVAARLCTDAALARATVEESRPAVVVSDDPALLAELGAGTGILLVDHPSVAARRLATRAGVGGLVSRADVTVVLTAAVRTVAEGRTWLPESEVVSGLTAREHEVLELLDRGLRLAQIAVALGISHATVKAHTRALHRKLGVTSRAEACFAARARGIL